MSPLPQPSRHPKAEAGGLTLRLACATLPEQVSAHIESHQFSRLICSNFFLLRSFGHQSSCVFLELALSPGTASDVIPPLRKHPGSSFYRTNKEALGGISCQARAQEPDVNVDFTALRGRHGSQRGALPQPPPGATHAWPLGTWLQQPAFVLCVPPPFPGPPHTCADLHVFK